MLHTMKLKLVWMQLMSCQAEAGLDAINEHMCYKRWKNLINVYRNRDSLLLQLRALFCIASLFCLHFPTIDTIERP